MQRWQYVCRKQQGVGLGENNQKWGVGVTQRRLGRDQLGRTHVC